MKFKAKHKAVLFSLFNIIGQQGPQPREVALEDLDEAVSLKKKVLRGVIEKDGMIQFSKEVIDVTDVQKPKFAGELMTGMGLGSPYEIKALTIKDNYLFLNDDDYGLRVLNIDNPYINLKFCEKGVNLY